MLESALAQPQQTFLGRYLYRTIFDKAAILLCSIIKNHPFIDGNKRTGIATTAVFLAFNGYLFNAPMDEVVEKCITVAGADGTSSRGEVVRW